MLPKTASKVELLQTLIAENGNDGRRRSCHKLKLTHKPQTLQHTVAWTRFEAMNDQQHAKDDAPLLRLGPDDCMSPVCAQDQPRYECSTCSGIACNLVGRILRKRCKLVQMHLHH